MSPHRRLSALDLFTIAAVLCLCIAAAVLLWQVQLQASAAERVTHTREVLLRVARIRLAITEAEASERGFLLGGGQAHVERYESAREVAARQLQELATLTRDNTNEQAVLAHLSSETERRMDTLRANIEDRTRLSAASRQPGEGGASRSRLAGYLVQLEAEEERLLLERRATALAARHGVAITGAGIVALALVLVLLLRAAAARERSGKSWRSAGSERLQPSRF